MQLSDEEWAARVVASDERVWIVDEAEGGALVGLVGGSVDRAEKIAYLGGMFVEPCHRRAGIGRRLVEAFEAWAANRGATTAVLEVNPALEPALRLYASCGYRPSGRRRRMRSDRSTTAIELAKALGP